MRKSTKIWLIAAACLVLIGCIMFGGVMSMLKWDFTKLSTVKYETNNYEIFEDYQNISIVTDTADIVFVPSENQNTHVLCHEQQNMKHSVTVKEGTLVIEVVDTRKWYEHIGIHFGGPKITVAIPKKQYGTLSVKTDTGDIAIPKNFTFESIAVSGSTGNVANYASALDGIKITTSTGKITVNNVSAGQIDLSVSTGSVAVSAVTCAGDVQIRVSTGKTDLADIQCNNLTSSGSTGSISLSNVIATGKISIQRSTGNVRLHESDAAEIFVETDTGDITGSLLTDKVFIAHTDTGRVDVPGTVTGGKCELRTDTGDISVTVK